EHQYGARWRRLVIEDRQHGIGRIALETIATVGPFLEEDIVANVAYNSFRTIREEDSDRRDILQCQDAVLVRNAFCRLDKEKLGRLGRCLSLRCCEVRSSQAQ